MLELRRLRLLHELEQRGTVAAVADALGYTPSAVSQQLAVLEREAGVTLLEPAGRGVRLTDPARVLAGHAAALLDRAARAEADLAAAAGAVAGRVRVAGFHSVLVHLALPALAELTGAAPELRCEVVEAEPEAALPALPLGDVDLVLGDEWGHHPVRLPAGVERHELLTEPVRVVLPADHPVAGDPDVPVRLADLAGAAWVSGPAGMGWDEMTVRTCRALGGFEPDVRHRLNDATIALAAVAAGLAVTLLPELVLGAPGPALAVRPIGGGDVARALFAATRATDAARPSTRAVLDAIRGRAVRLAGTPARPAA